MTKAERRKRAREKKRSALRGETPPVQVPEASAEAAAALLTEPLIDGGFVGGRVAPYPATATVDATSAYITGPIVPRLAPPARAALAGQQTAPRRVALSLGSVVQAEAGASAVGAIAADGQGEDGDDEGGGGAGDDGEDTVDGVDGEGEEGEEGEDGDDEESLDEEDALFNLACASVEEGDSLTWNELVTWMLAAEVDDPRLALLATLLVTDEDTTEVPKLTGARVLAALEHIHLGEMVAEAREAVASAPKEEGETDEERLVVRDTAREVSERAREQLAAPSSKALKASELRGAQSGRKAR